MTPVAWLAVFMGGGVGAAVRYAIGRFMGERNSGDLPLGTFIINVSGCFAIGVLEAIAGGTGASSLLLALLATGFLGGYTTFSTYTLEGLVLYLDGSRRAAVLGLLLPVMFGLPAVALGMALGRVARGA